MTELVFVMERRQNRFFVELMQALRDELEALGTASSLVIDDFPEPRRGQVNVLLPPHEYFELRAAAAPPDPALLRRSIFICAEQPGSQWFEHDVTLAKDAGAVLDINGWATQEWRTRYGVTAEHLPLGWTQRWDRSPLDGIRDIDVLFLGSHTDRRARHLSSYAQSLWRWRSHLILSDNGRPNHEEGPDFVAADRKRDLLARSRVLLNLHATDLPYLEGLRLVDAIHCGAVVVSEHSAYTAPFEPGRDYWSARPENLMLVAQELLENEEVRRRFAADALSRLRRELPLRSSAERLAAVAREVDRTAPVAPPRPSRAVELAPDVADREPPTPGATLDPDESVLRRALKSRTLELIATRREVARLELTLSGMPEAGAEVAATTPAHRAAEPRVSVLVSLYNYGRHIRAALDSVAAGSFRAFELIVVDDASTDDSLDLAVRWAGSHPDLAALVLHQRSNRGLAHARNTGLEFARGEFAFILDADNEIYPHCLSRLVEALDADPAAAFAYGMSERFEDAGPAGLISVGGWNPRRLRQVNHIDAMAMIRTEALRELSGYTSDDRLHGWEDYDLWCGMAESGRSGHAVREILGRYRQGSGSMLSSVTNLSTTEAYEALIERHPELMAGVTPPL